MLSGHSESENLLGEIMWLLAASHYRNSPDDLQVLSDAPAHRLFVLLPPVLPGMASLPPVLAVVQVCIFLIIHDRHTSFSLFHRLLGDSFPPLLGLSFLSLLFISLGIQPLSPSLSHY